jgi:chromosome segregation ATPase
MEPVIASAKAKLKEELEAWSAELQKLEAKAASAGAEAKAGLDEQIAELRVHLESGKSKLADMEARGEGAWEGVKDEIESVWGRIREAFGKAATLFK